MTRMIHCSAVHYVVGDIKGCLRRWSRWRTTRT